MLFAKLQRLSRDRTELAPIIPIEFVEEPPTFMEIANLRAPF
jgi:hypothetical protein